MINKKAWAIVEKYKPTHFISSTGPCCENCSLMLAAVTEALEKKEEHEEKIISIDFLDAIIRALKSGKDLSEISAKDLNITYSNTRKFSTPESMDQPDGFGENSQ